MGNSMERESIRIRKDWLGMGCGKMEQGQSGMGTQLIRRSPHLKLDQCDVISVYMSVSLYISKVQE